MDVFRYRYNGLYVTWMYFVIGTMGYMLHGCILLKVQLVMRYMDVCFYRCNGLYVTWMYFVIGAMGYMLRINELGDSEGNYSLVARDSIPDSDEFGIFPVGVFRLNDNLTALPVSSGK